MINYKNYTEKEVLKNNKKLFKKDKKICQDCRKLLFINEFYKRKGRWDGLSSYCRKCANKRVIKSFKRWGKKYIKTWRYKCKICGSESFKLYFDNLSGQKKIKNHSGICLLCTSMKNGYGKRTKTKDGTLCPSIQEAKTYDKLKSIFKNNIIHNFKGRFDFAIPKLKLIIEFHQFSYKKEYNKEVDWQPKKKQKTKKEYSQRRLNLMEEKGIGDWNLIVLTNQKEVDQYIKNN